MWLAAACLEEFKYLGSIVYSTPQAVREWAPSLRNALRPLLHDDESQQ